jgi:hypothetical protein
MIFNLSPQLREDTLELSVASDVVTINGEAFDFGPLNEGDELPATATSSEFLVGTITRTAGVIVLSIITPIIESASESAKFPDPINQTNGVVELPV